MSGRYAPIPNPLAQSADHDLDAAFGSDDEDDSPTETAPLNPRDYDSEPIRTPQSSHLIKTVNDDNNMSRRQNSLPGSYDFEVDPFDYAVPPPGSPPRPSHFAVPNPFGNSNGILPSAPAVPQRRTQPRPGILRRAVGALLPSYYQRIPTEDGHPSSSTVPLGGGMNNDGVFANITAKPARGRTVQDGESIYVVPEEAQKEAPPSYAVAQADQAPAYYETFVHAPSAGLDGEVLVDGMPTGSIFTFAWTMLISLSFQFVGFLFTYLLHTTHAARYGSRAGLGVTVIQYAFFLRQRAAQAQESLYDNAQASLWDTLPDTNNNNNNATAIMPPQPQGYFSPNTTEWLSFFLMSAGWFILLTSFMGYWRVKRWERGIRQASEPSVPIVTTEHDRDVRASIMSVFGLPLEEEAAHHDENGLPVTPGTQSAVARSFREQEAQLARDLRASGLL